MSSHCLPPPGFRWKIRAPNYKTILNNKRMKHRKPPLIAVGLGSPETPIEIDGPGSSVEPFEIDLEGPEDGRSGQDHAIAATSKLRKFKKLTPEDFYVNSILPPVRPNGNIDLECGICCNTFSHPVSLECRHTFCYACIRCAVQNNHRKCPICRITILNKPVRVARPLEHVLEADNKAAGVVDASAVSYSWAGVKF
ncbi:hypothetical protein C8F04DRAFT_291900 [Mycena alexandri]|uniref:RING-type domain-containing protein n=1 Tax=Mycena alexandri TaxID=1745969 RepID=A0AAD6T585_9AGAR|nr:hypothetical protein C8F04DRAFT_291900 [Mycena alexandri]